MLHIPSKQEDRGSAAPQDSTEEDFFSRFSGSALSPDAKLASVNSANVENKGLKSVTSSPAILSLNTRAGLYHRLLVSANGIVRNNCFSYVLSTQTSKQQSFAKYRRVFV